GLQGGHGPVAVADPFERGAHIGMRPEFRSIGQLSIDWFSKKTAYQKPAWPSTNRGLQVAAISDRNSLIRLSSARRGPV
ncbi:MAG: hypothetical protein MI755_21015, partial [Sphingomonadales bacterium]|nr:hypothetical protein [Sphingomonadales bacterium]